MADYQPVALHPEHEQIEQVLTTEYIHHFYHFTSIENLSSIFRTGAVLSKQALQKRGMLTNVCLGGDAYSQQMDAAQNNDGYVSLSYQPKLPMAYHVEARQHICYLVFNRRVALTEGIVFTKGNAASASTQRMSGLTGIQQVNFVAVRRKFAYKWYDAFHERQAEILVPDQIPIEAIEYVAFRSQSSLDEGRRLCSDLHTPPFQVQNDFFSRNFGCDQAWLLDHRPNFDGKSSITLSPAGPVFSRSEAAEITVLTTLYAEPEVVVEFEWRDPSGRLTISRSIRFDRGILEYETLPGDTLQPGGWQVSCYLSAQGTRVRQFTIPFEVR